MRNFRFLATIEAAVEHPDFPRTYLVQVVRPNLMVETARMPIELFEACAKRVTPHEPVIVTGFEVDQTSYISSFTSEAFHRETPHHPNAENYRGH